ncbi:MAG: dihydroorotate dehydrogenase-like protein [Bacteroidales bacterium]|nr:dihydroorotate dehydrogenase-like protein [Bacteroidales bacterium]MCF8391631.1 dihydroorotate dehydrogenase-like protein [Bacteroidales bacterium]
MINLRTTYLGLELKNPIIVGASDLVTKIENLKAAEEAGAAAIVYKSLFEEQIHLENQQMDSQMNSYNNRNSEMETLFPDISHAGPKEFLHNFRKAKNSINIPLIASINAVYNESWIEYAKLLEDSGADALELNLYSVPGSFEKEGRNILEEQLGIVKEIKKIMNISVSVKLSPNYTNILDVISQMDNAGADGYVLFNKLFQPDIDLEKEEHIAPFYLSSENDYRMALRYAGLLYGNTSASICASGGIYHGSDVLKLILAGADAVQVVSSLYKNKISHISTMLKEIEDWMNKKGYHSLKELNGKLSKKKTSDPYVYKRAQYIELLLKSGELTKENSLR